MEYILIMDYNLLKSYNYNTYIIIIRYKIMRDTKNTSITNIIIELNIINIKFIHIWVNYISLYVVIYYSYPNMCISYITIYGIMIYYK